AHALRPLARRREHPRRARTIGATLRRALPARPGLGPPDMMPSRVNSGSSFRLSPLQRVQAKWAQCERRTRSYPPPCGEGGARSAPGGGSAVKALAVPHIGTPTPNPFPQGGGEQTESVA